MAATQDPASFEEAAKQGDVRSQVVMAMSYLYGSTENPKNKTKAVYWLQKAADQGDVFALNTLGVMYAKGDGVPQSYTKAAQLFKKGVEQGDASAQSNLGRMYCRGLGVIQDKQKGSELLRTAAEFYLKRSGELEGNTTLEKGTRTVFEQQYESIVDEYNKYCTK